jgi:hypothetical protein
MNLGKDYSRLRVRVIEECSSDSNWRLDTIVIVP